MTQFIIGWDIGGAHVKAALLTQEGTLKNLALQSCPLWQGLDCLKRAVLAIDRQFDTRPCQHAITMTGELVDLFDNRVQGVEAIIRSMQAFLPDQSMQIYAGDHGFLTPSMIDPAQCLRVASANWLASVHFVAAQVANAVFVDIGSTTTDILLIENHRVKATGYTDYQRLVSDELVYTGIVRTAVMAVTQQAVFKQQEMSLMAEFFASMADVYRLSGDLNEAHDLSDTADGGAKTQVASARRLSRMTGYDFDEKDMSLWHDFAEDIKIRQKTRIMQAITRQVERGRQHDITLVGAGIGRFLVKEIAQDMGHSYIDFDNLIETKMQPNTLHSSDCAPAVAVAKLALQSSLV